MEKQKIMKWALPALLMSAMTFELMPGSVKCYTNDAASATEAAAYNFFTVVSDSVGASCLPIAGVLTFVTMVLALIAACLKKRGLYKLICWCSLGTGALAAVPYVVATEETMLQPNVIIILILTGCWLLAMALEKSKDQQEKIQQGRRL